MELKEKLKSLGAEIGMMELKRHGGIYVSMNEIKKKKREFAGLMRQYKKFRLNI